MEESENKTYKPLLIFLGGFFAIFGGVGVYLLASQQGRDAWTETMTAGAVFVAFSLMGWLILLKIKSHLNLLEELREKYPDSPWRWRPHWEKNLGEPTLTAMPYIASLLSLALIALSIPVVQQNWKSILAFKLPKALALAVPLMASAFTAWAVVAWLKRKKYGKIQCGLSAPPGVLGGHLQGQIRVGHKFSGSQKITAVLKCVHVYSSGSGKQRRTVRQILWCKDIQLNSQPAANGTGFQFKFDLPTDQPESDFTNPNKQIRWEVHVDGDVQGLDFEEIFYVPVYAASSVGIEAPSHSQASAKVESLRAAVSLDAAREIIESLDVQGRKQFLLNNSNPLRLLSLNLGLSSIMLLISTGAGFVVYQLFNNSMSTLAKWGALFFAMPFAIVGAVVGAIGLLILLNSFYQFFVKEMVVIYSEGIMAVRQSPLGPSQKFYRWDKFEKTYVHNTMTSNGQPILLSVRVKLKNARLPRTLMSSFFQPQSAHYLVQQIEKQRQPEHDAVANS